MNNNEILAGIRATVNAKVAVDKVIQPYPPQPPKNPKFPHACMGLNACANLGRTEKNSCAGQGYCSTTMDHTCHVLNECKNQGGCGLYGNAEEFSHPAVNDCQYQGSCATPINAERFTTSAPTPREEAAGMINNMGKSVWKLARSRFEARWALQQVDKPATAPPTPGASPFPDGPSIAWIEADGGGMTACGSSGLSGAGSCA